MALRGQLQFFLVLLTFLQWKHGHCTANVLQLPNTAMVKDGDLNIGGIIHYLAYSLDPVCANYTPYPGLHQLIQAMVYGIGKVNNNPKILPNVTLGYVILDDCTRVIPTVPRALQLLPLVKPGYESKDVLSFGKSYDVVGIIGPYNSEPNLLVASMTGFFEKPQISPFASSDALSDKTRFPYFFRTISPDKLIVKATVSFAKQIGWEYISIIYSEDEFGYNANKYVRKFAEELGICVEESYALGTNYRNIDYDDLLDTISDPKVRSKVFIVYLINSHFFFLGQVLLRRAKILDYVFITSQCTEFNLYRPIFRYLDGFITLKPVHSDHKEFYDYYKNTVNPWLRPEDPWVGSLWEQYFRCKLSPKGNETSCDQFPNLFDVPPAPGNVRNTIAFNAGRMVDAAHIFALALDDLINQECPDALGNRSLLRECVKGPLLREYLSRVEFKTKSGVGDIQFDDNFDGILTYHFLQIQSRPKGGFSEEIVGVYNPTNTKESVSVFKNTLRWSPQSKTNDYGMIESVCSHPCAKGEIYIQGDVECCWTCHKCRHNEITSDNATHCVICPELQWPDPETLFECKPIVPSYLTWTDLYGIGMAVLACIGILSTVTITFSLVRNRDRVIVRTSNKELMAVILLGAFMAYLSVPVFIMKPTNVSCIISRAGFSVSCTLLFAPLLVKSVRMFRIFKASADFQTNIRFVSITSQLVIVGILIIIQVALTVSTGFVWVPYADLYMPIKIQKYVELQCDLNMYGILIPLGFNIFLALLCSLCGFITRKLPDSFNESWYIFVSICTTVFIWIAFLPTYFAAFYAYHKAVLLALALFLNSSITIGCLFGPKIYAIYYIIDSEIQVTNFKGRKNPKSTSAIGSE